MDVTDTKTIYIGSESQPTRILKNNTHLENVSSLAELNINKWFYDQLQRKIHMIIDRFLPGYAPLFGNSQIGAEGTGWPSYTYTAGPYDVNEAATVSSIYLYPPTAGNAKVALYDSVYNENRYATYYDPLHVIVSSGEQSCNAAEWCQFNIPNTQISPGKYFLAIKMDSIGMISGTSRAGFGQYYTDDYANPFSDPFPSEGSTGSEYSIYTCCSEDSTPTTTTTSVSTTTIATTTSTTTPTTTTTVQTSTSTTTSIPTGEKTFGKTSNGESDANMWDIGSDNIVCSKFSLSEAGDVSKLSVYFYSGYGEKFKTAIYDINGNLKGVTEEKIFQYGHSWVWEDFVSSTPVSLSVGDYYLCFWAYQVDDLRFNGVRYISGTPSQSFTKSEPYNGFPDPIVKETEYDREIYIYATYTTS
jgi:hypothetical protein